MACAKIPASSSSSLTAVSAMRERTEDRRKSRDFIHNRRIVGNESKCTGKWRAADPPSLAVTSLE
jgi:hypothetical protein